MQKIFKKQQDNKEIVKNSVPQYLKYIHLAKAFYIVLIPDFTR